MCALFENDDIIHVAGSVGADIEIINLELALADLAQIGRQHHLNKPVPIKTLRWKWQCWKN